MPELVLELAGADRAKQVFKNIPDVIFHPFLSDNDFRDLFQRASLLVLPLLEGGSSQALNEAMACGLPVVTNLYPNLSDYTGTNGVITCKPGDVRAMAAACRTILKDENRRQHMSQAARNHVLQYDYSCIKERLLEIYHDHLSLSLKLSD